VESVRSSWFSRRFRRGCNWHQACRAVRVNVNLSIGRGLGSSWRPAALLALSSWLAWPAQASAAEVAPVAPAVARVSAAALLRESSRLAGWLARYSPEIHAARARLAQSSADVRTSHLLLNPVLDATLADVPVSETNPPGLSVGVLHASRLRPHSYGSFPRGDS
jgi:hypothetical protein